MITKRDKKRLLVQVNYLEMLINLTEREYVDAFGFKVSKAECIQKNIDQLKCLISELRK